jgi:hypothetical protein
MGLFWELIQMNQQHQHQERTSTLEGRVQYLEAELEHTRAVLDSLLQRLENHFGEDINRDGRVG